MTKREKIIYVIDELVTQAEMTKKGVEYFTFYPHKSSGDNIGIDEVAEILSFLVDGNPLLFSARTMVSNSSSPHLRINCTTFEVLNNPSMLEYLKKKLLGEKGVEESLNIKPSFKTELTVFQNDNLKITFNGVVFYINGKCVKKINRGGIPMKIWGFGHKNNTLLIPWTRLDEVGVDRAGIEESVNKTHRGDLFRSIEKHCLENGFKLPSDFFENLLRPVPGEGYALFDNTKVSIE